MPEDLDLLAAIADDPQGERIAAALAILGQVRTYAFSRTHTSDCWQWHAGCLAARVRTTLTGAG